MLLDKQALQVPLVRMEMMETEVVKVAIVALSLMELKLAQEPAACRLVFPVVLVVKATRVQMVVLAVGAGLLMTTVAFFVEVLKMVETVLLEVTLRSEVL